MRIYIVCLLALSISVLALAVAASQHSRAADEATRIVIDHEADAIRFVIDGRVVAVVDGTSLHVRGDINYGGSLTDYGGVGFDMQTGGEAGDAP